MPSSTLIVIGADVTLLGFIGGLIFLIYFIAAKYRGRNINREVWMNHLSITTGALSLVAVLGFPGALLLQSVNPQFRYSVINFLLGFLPFAGLPIALFSVMVALVERRLNKGQHTSFGSLLAVTAIIATVVLATVFGRSAFFCRQPMDRISTQVCFSSVPDIRLQ